MSQTVLVLGASGLFGSAAAKAFATAGWQVRRYQRGTDMAAAAMGADVIVNALNPPGYHAWATLIPQITAQVIAAGLASGATVIVPGNVYVYGDQPGPWGPQTPHRPVSRKGTIRAEMEAAYQAAADRGLRVIILRGGDFIAPEQAGSILRMVVMKHLARRRLTAMGNPAVQRAYAYLPDMTRAAVALAEIRAKLPAFADIPFAGNSLSVNDMAQGLARISGHRMTVGRFFWPMMWALSPFWELARELHEMRYLFETPHSLDPAPMAALLPDWRATPLDVILRAHLTPL